MENKNGNSSTIIGYAFMVVVIISFIFAITHSFIRFCSGYNELSYEIEKKQNLITDLYTRINKLEQQIKDLTADKKDGNIEL